MTTEVKYGYMHTHCGPDMDGSRTTFEWIEDHPMEDDPDPRPGWFAKSEVEPEAGWIGPFESKESAILVATNEAVFWAYMNSEAFT